MESQSFSNHVRVHPVYHYFAVPVSLGLVLAALLNLILHFSLGSAILFISMIVLHLAIFLGRDYAKKNQDRIIRTELRLRYFQLTGKRLEEWENQFAIGQLLATRFASDEELVELIQNPETQKKKPEAIKHQIIQWNADRMRV
jgi:Family of unknown function (DUF6526)